MGEWLRTKGLHATNLRDWRQAIFAASEDALIPSKPKKLSPEVKRIKELERELHRKENALAEAAALLVLAKEVKALWGDEDASMGLRNDDESSR